MNSQEWRKKARYAEREDRWLMALMVVMVLAVISFAMGRDVQPIVLFVAACIGGLAVWRTFNSLSADECRNRALIAEVEEFTMKLQKVFRLDGSPSQSISSFAPSRNPPKLSDDCATIYAAEKRYPSIVNSGFGDDFRIELSGDDYGSSGGDSGSSGDD